MESVFHCALTSDECDQATLKDEFDLILWKSEFQIGNCYTLDRRD